MIMLKQTINYFSEELWQKHTQTEEHQLKRHALRYL